MVKPGRKAFVLSISGASSSGKTTLSRLLRDIFPDAFILHEDDFYKEDSEIPVTDGLSDWDCPGALAIPDIVNILKYIQSNGNIPPHFDSKEAQNTIGSCPVSEAVVASLKSEVSEWNRRRQIFTGGKNCLSLCIFDGFLIYSQSMLPLQQYIDIKLFLLVSYAEAKARREARSGYVTTEGFWEDPPEYVDKIVWPNYVRNHKWMFEDGNVEGKVKDDKVREWGILTQAGGGPDIDMETTLKWAVATIIRELEMITMKEPGTD